VYKKLYFTRSITFTLNTFLLPKESNKPIEAFTEQGYWNSASKSVCYLVKLCLLRKWLESNSKL